ncbi:MAG: hypothetical protein LBR55_02110 [Bacteroidales bacterium]|jgi:hypothetical protein|nr:hypothetical protein [Bacteroidales bacterium]
MKKKIELLIMTIFIPSVIFAHNPGGASISWGIMFIISLIISLLLLKKIRKHIAIENKFLRFATLFVIEVTLLFFLTIALMLTLGTWIYIHIFGG